MCLIRVRTSLYAMCAFMLSRLIPPPLCQFYSCSLIKNNLSSVHALTSRMESRIFTRCNKELCYSSKEIALLKAYPQPNKKLSNVSPARNYREAHWWEHKL